MRRSFTVNGPESGEPGEKGSTFYLGQIVEEGGTELRIVLKEQEELAVAVMHKLCARVRGNSRGAKGGCTLCLSRNVR